MTVIGLDALFQRFFSAMQAVRIFNDTDMQAHEHIQQFSTIWCAPDFTIAATGLQLQQQCALVAV